MPTKTPIAANNTPDYAPRERGLIRRDKIIQAATQVFVRSGFEAASLQEIVALAEAHSPPCTGYLVIKKGYFTPLSNVRVTSYSVK
ncbi:hypothetical protein P4S73_18155 [Paraglaciecola sp. Hal342]